MQVCMNSAVEWRREEEKPFEKYGKKGRKTTMQGEC